MQENYTERMKKSVYIAKSSYEYKKLVFPRPYLLDMSLEEDKEELQLSYDLERKQSVSQVREEDTLTVLKVLMNIKELQQGLQEYNFSLNPQNLYYDLNTKVYAKVRDVYPAGDGFDEQRFLEDYRALIGFALQKKYSYEDFRQGGKRLLEKDVLQNKIYHTQNASEIYDVLFEEYERIKDEQEQNKVLIKKKLYQKMKAAIIILGVLTAVSFAGAGYWMLSLNPYQKAILAADNAYIEGDYVKCIDFMKKIDVTSMESHQKYILATAYVKSENLTQEQKNNILETISLKAAPERLEYWIYLGRNQTEEAINVAMQQSDNQLLLYAYMKEKSLTEADTSLSGDEKAKKLEEISSKMEPLIEQYNTEDE